MSELPNGWAGTEIGEVMKIVSGGTPPSKDESNFDLTGGGIPWLTPADLSGYRERFIAKGARNLSDKGYAACSAAKMPAGSVLFSSRAPIGYVVIAANEISTNQGFKSFIPPEGFNSSFLYYYLKHIKPVAEQMATGTTFKELSGSAAAKLPLLAAPLPEQKRIADKLDTVLTRVEACRDRLDRIPALLKRFRQSILAAATSGRLTEDWRTTFAPSPIAERSAALVNFRAEMWKGRGKYKPAILASEADSQEFLDLPESWIRGTLDQVTWSVKDGPHFSPKYQETGIPFISGGSIKPGKIDLSIAKFISQELHSELSQRCKPDYLDVLYTKGGTTGIAAVNTLTDDFNVWVHVAVLKLLPEECINPFFLQNTLNSPKCYEQSQRYTHGVGNQDLGLTRMVKIVLPIPPVEEQTEIVRRVEILFAFADRLEARLATARKQAEQLTPALLAKAFRGELVPQDPNDEPASELLKRLATTHSETPKANHRRKTAK